MDGFWSVWFRTGLYDRLMPINYDESIRHSFELLAPGPKDSVVDLGSGNGRILNHAQAWLKAGGRLTLVDIDADGLRAARNRAKKLGVFPQTSYFLNDLRTLEALEPESYDGALSHFSTYTMSSKRDQAELLERFFRVLKPNALLVLSGPSEKYRVETIIAGAKTTEPSFFKKHFLYRLTAKAMLSIEKKLDSGEFKYYADTELKEQLKAAGFKVEKIKSGYSECGWHAIARKP